jgi:hypothetical protein
MNESCFELDQEIYRRSSAPLVRITKGLSVIERISEPVDSVVFVLRGEVRVDRSEQPLPTGSFTFIRAGQVTTCFPSLDCALLIMHIDPQHLPSGVFTAGKHLSHFLKEMELYLCQAPVDEQLMRLKIREFCCLFKAFHTHPAN